MRELENSFPAIHRLSRLVCDDGWLRVSLHEGRSQWHQYRAQRWKTLWAIMVVILLENTWQIVQLDH